LIFRIGNLLAGIFASFLEYLKAKDTRSSRDYPASLRNFPSHSGHLSDRRPKSGRFPVGISGRLRSEWWPLSVGIPGRNPSEYAFSIKLIFDSSIDILKGRPHTINGLRLKKPILPANVVPR
jgi:hypothetical protein